MFIGIQSSGSARASPRHLHRSSRRQIRTTFEITYSLLTIPFPLRRKPFSYHVKRGLTFKMHVFSGAFRVVLKPTVMVKVLAGKFRPEPDHRAHSPELTSPTNR